MSLPLEQASVLRVQAALEAAGSRAKVVALAETARSAADAAKAIGVPVGAIVKTLVFRAGDAALIALIAGDRQCDTAALGRALGVAVPVKRADADFVRAKTGFAIGGVAPVGQAEGNRLAIDRSLGRFETVWAAAGHPYCVFPTTLDELVRITGGVLAAEIGIDPAG